MKFYNRKSELKLLEKIISGTSTRIVVVRGFRRIGKTRLLIESLKNKEYIRIFIPKDMTSSSFLRDLSEKHKLPLFTRIKDFLIYVFERYEYVFLDEFQNFEYVDKSVFSELQDIIDEYKRENKKIAIFITGSSFSMLKKIFYDYAKALYGRKDFEIFLTEFNIKTVMNILSDLGIEDIEEQIKFWSIFGGIPKHYEMLESLKANNFQEFIDIFYMKNFRSLMEEGKTILISELGGEYKTYYTIMEALAFSKNKLSEIASLFDNDKNAVNRYINLLINEYDLIKKTASLIGTKGKNTRYRNKSNFIDFWFRFVRRYYDLYDIGREKEISERFNNEFDSYLGRKFEEFIIGLFDDIFPKFNFDKIGNQWGKFKGETGKNAYEIDIAALNKKTKKVLFGECKWKEKVDAEKVILELIKKAEYVDWNKGNRKEYFAVFAKSFSKKIDNYEGKQVYCYDLRDLSNMKLGVN